MTIKVLKNAEIESQTETAKSISAKFRKLMKFLLPLEVLKNAENESLTEAA